MRRTLQSAICMASIGLVIGCGPHTVNGTSHSTMTFPPGTVLHIKGPANFNGIEIPAGGELDIELTKGGTIDTTDEIHGQMRVAQGTGGSQGTGTIDAGSTYSFMVPDLLGQNVSKPVPITGQFSFAAKPGAVRQLANGSFALNPAGLTSAQCAFTGAAPVWQLPLFNTPFGDITGTGTVEGDPFTARCDGDLSRISGLMSGDQFTGTFGLTLQMGNVVGVGLETEDGAIAQ